MLKILELVPSCKCVGAYPGAEEVHSHGVEKRVVRHKSQRRDSLCQSIIEGGLENGLANCGQEDITKKVHAGWA
jgi:hypothetical protein